MERARCPARHRRRATLAPAAHHPAAGRHLPGLHRRLLEAYRSRCTAGWPSGPDDGYFFTWLAYHLWEAGQRAELRRLLLDPGWMRAKLTKKDSAALRADYAYPENRGQASASQAWFARARRSLSPIFIPPGEVHLMGDYPFEDRDLELVQGALRLSAHLLTKAPGLLTGQLVGRLISVDSPAIRELLASARRSECGLWSEPTRQTLTPPGGPLLRTLEGHADGVTAVTVPSLLAPSPLTR